jgi:hypothetical protein
MMKISVPKLISLCQQNDEFYKKETSLIVKRRGPFCLLRYRSDDDVYHQEYSEELEASRGIVIHVDKAEVLCAPWTNKIPYTLFKRKFSFTEISQATSLEDGTMVNLFYDDSFTESNQPKGFEHWHLSTTTCVDAKQSRWNSAKSFHTMFWETVPDLCVENLDKNISYSFVLQHVENRIVVPVLENRLILTLARDRNNLKPVTETITIESLSKHIQLPRPCQLSDVSNYEELESMASSQEHPMGLMLFGEDGTRTRIRNPLYTEVLELRGSNPNKWTNYLYLFNQELDEDYLSHYPEEEDSMNSCWEALVSCLKFIHQLYQSIYVSKEYQPVPFYLKRFINRIHRLYLHRKKSLEHPGITHKVIKGLFHQLPYQEQNKIIRSYQL